MSQITKTEARGVAALRLAQPVNPGTAMWTPNFTEKLSARQVAIDRFQRDTSDPSVIVFSEINVVNFRTPLNFFKKQFLLVLHRPNVFSHGKGKTRVSRA